jgi:hypothetical protein
MRDFYHKRNVPPEIWEEIDRELYGKPFTELAGITTAAIKRFESFIANRGGDDEGAPAPTHGMGHGAEGATLS